MKNKQNAISKFIVIMLIAVSLLLVGCKDTPQGNEPPVETPVEVTHTFWKILEGEISETTVHKYVTNKPGPKIVIVGGIHGDEDAGWTAALRLVNTISQEKGICGEILLIPQANILADNALVRYNVKGMGVTFSDLNRSFAVGRDSAAKSETIKISNALVEVIDEFIDDHEIVNEYDLCIIDLHESRGSYTEGTAAKGYLGDQLICRNNPFFMEDLLIHYNENYKELGDPNFRTEEAVTDGSFSLNFTTNYPDATVFTIETNRGYKNGTNTIALEKRVSQQLNILQALFDLAWQRI
ncbi:MAG: succinylglutamate desuccinylase/aspartoacylase family protein [Clostridia bacterium]|nr:succinylglutamate desuccinylase/aspartoacylase family protein [Clostridia bacterium]